jgi:uncharacterized repeat protein (TIGR03843 family)
MAEPVFDFTDPATLDFLHNGHIEVEGRLVDASNLTLFAEVEFEGVAAKAVYKPVSGEQPLWDFPEGTLAGREVATYLISAASGLGAVPPTVVRDGPFGPGMVQLWIDTIDKPLLDVCPPEDLRAGWRTILEAEDQSGAPLVVAHADHPGLRALSILDIVVNNADRKGGHLLNTAGGVVYGIDHGICLHEDPKLRTVLWGWFGEPLPESIIEKLQAVPEMIEGDLGKQLSEHITSQEIRAVSARVTALLAQGVFPIPEPNRNPVPWPLF